jgi:hypothetical protein
VKASWATRFLVLLGFVAFDLSATWLSLSSSAEESNVFARNLMQVLGFSTGLILFSGIVTCALFLILRFCSRMLDNIEGTVKTVGIVTLDFGLAWFVAGAHFVGGTSWFWPVPEMLRHIIGASIYVLALTALWLGSARSRM